MREPVFQFRLSDCEEMLLNGGGARNERGNEEEGRAKGNAERQEDMGDVGRMKLA